MQLGLPGKALDKLRNAVNNEDVLYRSNMRVKMHPVDTGLVLGIVYRLNGRNAMNFRIQYHYGLVPLCKGSIKPNQFVNRSFYVTAGIQIGKGKAAEPNE